jgi:hypothetical protein
MVDLSLMAVALAAVAGAGTVLLAQHWVRGAKGRGADLVDADLEKQLERARSIPGAEPMLDRLSRQPVIFARELADFAAQLDNLERKSKVEEARKHAASERRAPLVARIAREAIADMEARRVRPATRDILNAEGELVAIARPSCAPAKPG